MSKSYLKQNIYSSIIWGVLSCYNILLFKWLRTNIINLVFPGKRHTCGTFCQCPGSCQGYIVAGWLLRIFGAPHCQLVLVSDSRPKLSKCLHWMDANINGLLEQTSSFFERESGYRVFFPKGHVRTCQHWFFPLRGAHQNYTVKPVLLKTPIRPCIIPDLFFVPWYKIISLLNL